MRSLTPLEIINTPLIHPANNPSDALGSVHPLTDALLQHLLELRLGFDHHPKSKS